MNEKIRNLEAQIAKIVNDKNHSAHPENAHRVNHELEARRLHRLRIQLMELEASEKGK